MISPHAFRLSQFSWQPRGLLPHRVIAGEPAQTVLALVTAAAIG